MIRKVLNEKMENRKKHKVWAAFVLSIISLLFNNLLEEGENYKNIGNTIKGCFFQYFWGLFLRIY